MNVYLLGAAGLRYREANVCQSESGCHKKITADKDKRQKKYEAAGQFNLGSSTLFLYIS